MIWHGLGSLVPGVLVLLEPDLELLPTTSDLPCSWCHLNSLSFLSPPRLSLASTSGIFVVSVFPCPSMVLWDPCATCRVGGFLSLAAPCALSWESQLPKLQSSFQLPVIPVNPRKGMLCTGSCGQQPDWNTRKFMACLESSSTTRTQQPFLSYQGNF